MVRLIFHTFTAKVKTDNNTKRTYTTLMKAFSKYKMDYETYFLGEVMSVGGSADPAMLNIMLNGKRIKYLGSC